MWSEFCISSKAFSETFEIFTEPLAAQKQPCLSAVLKYITCIVIQGDWKMWKLASSFHHGLHFRNVQERSLGLT